MEPLAATPVADPLGPLAILLCWQALTLSVGIYVTTGAVKTGVLLWAAATPQRTAWAKGVVLPLVPLLLGALAAVVFPLRPEALVAWVEAQQLGGGLLVYAAWGACVGQFADYLHQRVTGMLNLREAVRSPAQDSAPPSA